MDNNLFNLESIKKFDGKYNLTPEKEVILQKYIARLNNNEFKGETKGYPAFLKFLEDILDYKEEEHIKFDDKVDIGQDRVEFCLKNDNVKFMAIELKGSEVADLEKPQNRVNDKRSPVDQAFDYAEKSSRESGIIDWILVSNYKEFRLYNYVKRQGEFISFNADELLDSENFKIFMFAFSKDSHLDSGAINEIIKEDYVERTKLVNNFYKLFNETRLMIFKELNELHDIDKVKAISYSQSILDRFVFICFASSRGLLPYNIAHKTLLNRINQENLRDYEIWRELNYLFIDVNQGKSDRGISGYNGGLFKENFSFIKLKDIINDNNFFDDVYQKWNFNEYENILKKEIKLSILKRINPIYVNLLIISLFDFSEDKKENNGYKLDIEILGHIFENSIGDIEEIKDESKGRRKKEGIYYTPDFITDFICKNTIIPYLSKSGNANTLDDLLDEYSWSRDIEKLDLKLKNIKIVDPACGSGAFLNKATDILLDIHKAIYDIKQGYTRTTTMKVGKKGYRKDGLVKHFDLDSVLFDAISKRREILLNNIFGVDLNEESVEITKLSLFLKVCQENKKLPDLDDNIKCGNSLIGDDEYTDKPFQWNKEFPQVFKGDSRFDVVIGNPPYVRQEKIKDIKPYLKDNYPKTYHGLADLYVYFFERGLNILNPGGMFSFICANKFLRTKNDKPIRKFILKHKFLKYIDYTGRNVFDDVTTNPCIIVLKNEKSSPDDKICVNNEFYLQQSQFDENVWAFENPKVLKLKNKLNQIGTKIKDIENLSIYYGIKTGYDKAFIIDENTKDSLIKQDSRNNDKIKPLLRGRNIKRYNNDFKNLYLILSESGLNLEIEYPYLYKFFKNNEETLKKRSDQGKYWYNLRDCAYYDEFNEEKIIWSNIANKPNFSYSDDGKFVDASAYFLTIAGSKFNTKYVLANLNSNINYFIYNLIGEKIAGGYQQWKKNKVEQLLVYPATPQQQENFILKVDQILNLNKDLVEEINSFKDWLRHTYNINKFSRKMENYYESNLDNLLDELKKIKINLKPNQIKILKEIFDDNKEKVNRLNAEINKIDFEIDRMIYKLYGLTDDEIIIINNFLGIN